MSKQNETARITARFVEALAENPSWYTESIIRMVAREFRVPQSVVVDAITKGQPTKKGARK